LLTNETYQKDKAMLDLLNTRIKEMLGEDIKKLRDKMDQLSEAKNKDRTGDGKKNFDDVQVARMTAGGVPKKKAIAKATSDNFKEAMSKKCCCSTKGKEKCPVHGMKEAQGDDAKARVAQQQADRDDPMSPSYKDKKEKSSGVTRVKGTSYGNQAQEKEKDKDLEEGKSCSKGHTKMTKGCKECAGMYEAKQSKPDKNNNNIPDSAEDGKGPHDTKKKGAAPKKGVNPFAKKDEKKKVKESFNQFKHNVQFVNESLGYLLQEDEEGKAKAITAAGDMVNDFTSWMQRVGQYQTKTMIELADAIKADFGAQEAEAFKAAVGPALSSTLETLTQQREAVSGAVATLAGEATAEVSMGMEPEMPPEPGMDMSAPDEMNPAPAGDEFGAADAAAGMGTTGREMRESRFARKLAESHNIMSSLAK